MSKRRDEDVANGSVRKSSNDEDYGNEDFEAYEEDFEDDEIDTPVIPPPKIVPAPIPQQSSKRTASSIPNQAKIIAPEKDNTIHDAINAVKSENNALAMKKQENQAKLTQSEPKTTPSSTNSPIQQQPKAIQQTKRIKKYGGSIGTTIESTISLDPRYRRLNKLLSSGILDLQEEKFTYLNIAPTTRFDLYQRQLRDQNSQLKQIGVPNDLELRDIEVSTDEIIMCNKEIQFNNSDETTFLNVLKAIEKKLSKNIDTTTNESEKSISEILLNEKLQNNNKNISNETNNETSTANLMNFLQKSSQLMETLLDENVLYSQQNDKIEENSKKNSIKSIFSDEFSWKFFGELSGNGMNELIRYRDTMITKYSELQPHIMLTVHPYNDKNSDDLKPYKSLYCIWDMNTLLKPQYILESNGNPTCVTFSRSQTHIVLVGTQEGCLYLWDLRESSSFHKDR